MANDLPPAEQAATDTSTASDTTTAPDPAKTQVPTPEAKTTPPAAVVDVKAILEAINADREDREARAKRDQERDSYKSRAEMAEAKLADFEKSKKNRLLNPAGFLKKMGYTDQELALTAEGIMFALMPDKAPPGHVAKLVQAQREQDLADQEEREKNRAAEEQKRAAEAETQELKNLEARYTAALKRDVTAFKPGTYPASQAWFADDHDAYVQELIATARQLTTGLQPGQTVDITTAGVAPALEKKYAERAQRLIAAFNSRPQKDTTQQTKTQVQAPASEDRLPVQPTETPKPNTRVKFPTDRERIDAAIAAAFGA